MCSLYLSADLTSHLPVFLPKWIQSGEKLWSSVIILVSLKWEKFSGFRHSGF